MGPEIDYMLIALVGFVMGIVGATVFMASVALLSGGEDGAAEDD